LASPRSKRFIGDVVDLPARKIPLSEESLIAVQDKHEVRGVRPAPRYVTLEQLGQYLFEIFELDADDDDGAVPGTDGEMGRPVNIAQVVLTTSAAVVANPGSKRLKVTEIRAVNPGPSPCQVTMWHDVDGAVFNDASLILPVHTIPPGTIFRDLNTNIVLVGSGRLGAKASIADKLTLTVYGVEVT